MCEDFMWNKYSRYFIQVALLASVYFLAARLGLFLAFEQANTSPVWPPTGISIAAMLYFGLRLWPGIFMGALLINLYISSPLSLAFSIAIGNTLEAVVAGFLILRYASSSPFTKTRETVLFIFVLSFSTMISASIGVGSLYKADIIGEGALGLLWKTWWFGDLIGGLVLTPFLITWRYLPKICYSRIKALEGALILIVTFAIIFLVFLSNLHLHSGHYLLVFSIFPIVAWAALRFHHHGATLIVLLMSAGAILGTLSGYGPFILSTENESLLVLQAALGTVMLTALLLIASQEERLNAISKLMQVQCNLESTVSIRTDSLNTTNKQLEKEIEHQQQLTGSLQQLLKIIDHSAAAEFFIRCVEGLTITFQTRFAFIGVFADQNKSSIKTLAVWGGGQPGENFTYKLKGTPCEDVLNHSMELVAENAAEQYPHDEMLDLMGIESYFGSPIKTPSGEIIGIVAVMDTQILKIEEWLQPILGLFSNRIGFELLRRSATEEQELAESVFKESTEAIIVCDAHTNIIRINPECTKMMGYSLEDVFGKKPNIWKSGKHNIEFYKQLWTTLKEEGIWQGEIINKRKNGALFISRQIIKAILDENGNIHQYISIINDITEKKQAEERIYRLAHYDVITQLPNRTSFHNQLNEAMAKAEKSISKLAVMFIDLDHFKLINDTSGHSVGDELLLQVASRFRKVIDESNLLSRFGGDEFTVMLPCIESVGYVSDVASKVLNALVAPFNLSSCEITISASIGISIFPDNGTDVSMLLSCADNAMYRAKESGRSSFQFYSEQMKRDAKERVALEHDLRNALSSGEFELHYQPQIDLKTKQVIGIEALIRWLHPSKGVIPPDKFIPVAEVTGLIVPIGEWVINEACQKLQQCHKEGFYNINMAINLSARQFFQEDILVIIKESIKTAGVQASNLEFEITESMMMSNIEETVDILHEIKTLGVQLSIDDFGTGYSSLSYLKRFPLNKLKIDKSFVQGLPNDSDDVAIVKATIAIAHSLKLTVIAEGVETEEQLSMLKSYQCDEVQGYYFSRPLPDKELMHYLYKSLPAKISAT